METLTKPVFWTTRAKKDLGKLLRFNTKFHGLEKAKEIVESIRQHTEVLENQNYDFKKIGERDDDFSHLKHNYRKLVSHHCKITYREGKSKIYIVRVFDTRQDPKKNR